MYTVADLLNFTETSPLEDYPDRNAAVWQYDLSMNLTQDSPAYTAALDYDLYLGGNGTILGALDKYDLDALILPANQVAGIAAIAGKHDVVPSTVVIVEIILRSDTKHLQDILQSQCR